MSRFSRLLELLPEIAGVTLAVALAGGYLAGVIVAGIAGGIWYALLALVPVGIGCVMALFP